MATAEPAHVAEVGAASGQFALDALAVQAGICGNYHLLLVAEKVDQLVVKRLDIGQQPHPVSAGVRPGDLDRVLGVPFGQ